MTSIILHICLPLRPLSIVSCCNVKFYIAFNDEDTGHVCPIGWNFQKETKGYYSYSESEDELDDPSVSLLTMTVLFSAVLVACFFLGLYTASPFAWRAQLLVILYRSSSSVRVVQVQVLLSSALSSACTCSRPPMHEGFRTGKRAEGQPCNVTP